MVPLRDINERTLTVTSTDIGYSRQDIHSPVNFMPENYSFVGCFHNRYVFCPNNQPGRYAAYDAAATKLLALLGSNERPNGPGVTNCDHCGAAIAFVGVFQHKDGEYIAVGSTCAENRFPLSNIEFQKLRKAHRLSSAARRAEAKFDEFKLDHPEVDWAAAEVSTNSTIRYALSQGRKYGSLFDYRLQQIQGILQAAEREAIRAAYTVPEAPATTPVPENPDQEVYDFLAAYDGDSGFLNSLKSQAAAGRVLTPKQVAAARRNLPSAQATKNVNQDVLPGIYIATDGTVWKVQGNAAYKSALKRAIKAQAADPHAAAKEAYQARVYAKVWSNHDQSRVLLSEARDMTQAQSWVYLAGAIQTLQIDHRMTVEEAKTFGQLYSQCVNCGRTLEADKSIEQAIGPVCIKYFQNWGHSELDHAGHAH